MDSGPCPYCGGDVAARNSFSQLHVGCVLNGRHSSYRVGMAIGSGGFGQTYIARDLNEVRRVAIKEYYPKRCNLQRDPSGHVRTAMPDSSVYQSGMKSFLTEATMLKALNDIKGIVHVYDFFEAFGTAYMVMEYVVGETLRTAVERRGAMEARQLLAAMLPLMRDIAAINDAGVVHRDINPQNIIVMPAGMLRLIDFGCARSVEDGKSMEVLLTPGFAPPEQYSRHGQGPYTDVYGLCATIYYCLTQTIPPDSNERVAAMFNGQQDPLIMPSRMGVRLPDGVEPILLGGMRTSPKERIQTMDALADALAPLVIGRSIPITVRPKVPPQVKSGPGGRTTKSGPGGRTTKSGTGGRLSKRGRYTKEDKQTTMGQTGKAVQKRLPKASQSNGAKGSAAKGQGSQQSQVIILLIVLVALSAIGIIAIIASISGSPQAPSTTPVEQSQVVEEQPSEPSGEAQVTPVGTKTEVTSGRKVKSGGSGGESMPV